MDSQRTGAHPGAAPLSQRHFETIFNAIHDAILVLDAETQQILHANNQVLGLLGYHPEEILRRDLKSLLMEDDPGALNEAQLVDGVYGPVRMRCAGGTTRSTDVAVAVIPWDGQPALLYSLRDVTERTRLEDERARLIAELRNALAEVKQLSGLLPICANCKRIRDDQGYWATVEQYISQHTEAEFSHGICPECRDKLYPELPRKA